MRVLRSSMYIDAYTPPITTVTRDIDLADTIESSKFKLLMPGQFVCFDVFGASPKADIPEVTRKAMQRWQQNLQQEAHQAMLYYWTVGQWQLLAPEGVMTMDKPAPLSEKEIHFVFEQLRQHPDYNKGWTIVAHDRRGVRISLKG